MIGARVGVSCCGGASASFAVDNFQRGVIFIFNHLENNGRTGPNIYFEEGTVAIVTGWKGASNKSRGKESVTYGFVIIRFQSQKRSDSSSFPILEVVVATQTSYK